MTHGCHGRLPVIVPSRSQDSPKGSEGSPSLFFFAPTMTHPQASSFPGGIARRLESLLAVSAEDFGYEILLLEWLTGKGQVMRIYLDGPDGVSIDACAKMSRMFSQVLEAAETSGEHPEVARALSRPYSLEVSSPGLDRPLRKAAHFAAHVGHKANVQTRTSLDPISGQKKVTAVIDGVDVPEGSADPYDGTVRLVAVDTQESYAVNLGDIRRANLVYEG